MLDERRAVRRVPVEVWERVLMCLAPADLARARTALRALYQASVSPSLWRAQCAVAGVPLAPQAAGGAPAAYARYMEHALCCAQRVKRRWNIYGARPTHVVRFRAHVSRITALRLVVGDVRPGRTSPDCWLVTGSVDGYVRVWDVHRALQVRGHHDVTQDFARAPPSDDDTAVDTDSGTDPAPDMQRTARTLLVAEVNTDGDVTALDVQMHADRGGFTVAVASYYSSGGCLVYDLRLESRPRVLDVRAALDPPEWCGPQCVSVCRDAVAVGSYTGVVYVLHMHTGWRGVVDVAERGSIAAVKLLADRVVVVTRLGALVVYSLPAPLAPAKLLAQHTIAERPLVSVALGEVTAAMLPVVLTDASSFVHLEVPCAGDAAAAPRVAMQVSVPGERLIGACVGASGRRGALVSSLGGVPPVCAVRGYECERGLRPLRATPDVVLPSERVRSVEAEGASRVPSEGAVRRPSDGAVPVPMASRAGDALRVPSSALSISPHEPSSPQFSSPGEARPRRVRVDSFSSTSTSSTPSPSSRIDMLTDSAMDEVQGLLVLASMRGAVWMADYGAAS